MKIKITENQYSKIRLVLEQEEYVNTFKNFCTSKLTELNGLYAKLVNSSVSDVLSGQVNIDGINQKVQKIEGELTSARNNIEILQSKNLIDDVDGIYEIADAVDNKINSLSVLIYNLAEIEEKRDLIMNGYGDVNPIQI